MKRRSKVKYNKDFKDVFTKEVYENLKNGVACRFNLENNKVEEMPEVIDAGEYVTFCIKEIHNMKTVVIYDFTMIMFNYEYLIKYNYDELLKVIEKEGIF